METTKQDQSSASDEKPAATPPLTGSEASVAPPALSGTAAWAITGSQLQLLWTEIYPIIVAHSWGTAPENEKFRACFEDAFSFREGAVVAVASVLDKHHPWRPPFVWPAGLKIHVDTETPRQTHFLLSHRGISLPWPDSPFANSGTVPDIQTAYSLMGGRLPRMREYTNGEDDLEAAIRAALSALNRENCRQDAQPPFRKETTFSGQAVFDLISQLPRIVARSWSDAAFKRKYQKTPWQVITDISFPPIIKVVPPEIEKSEELTIMHQSGTGTGLRLILPLPDYPPNPSATIKELILGYASNPMYSNCY